MAKENQPPKSDDKMGGATGTKGFVRVPSNQVISTSTIIPSGVEMTAEEVQKAITRK